MLQTDISTNKGSASTLTLIATKNNSPRRILRPREAAEIIGVGRTTLYIFEQRDPHFPRKVRLSSRHVGYFADEIAAWLESRKGA